MSTSNLAIDIAPYKMKFFHPDKNGLLNPFRLSKGSHKKVWWKCDKGHEWQISVNVMLKVSYLCPYCEKLRPHAEYNLQTEYPNIATSWHPIKNQGCKATDVLPMGLIPLFSSLCFSIKIFSQPYSFSLSICNAKSFFFVG